MKRRVRIYRTVKDSWFSDIYNNNINDPKSRLRYITHGSTISYHHRYFHAYSHWNSFFPSKTHVSRTTLVETKSETEENQADD